MLKRSAISFILLFASVYPLLSQNYIGNNYKEFDSITYAHYINQEWKKVINYGNIALNKEIDYYYLRMRMGIASYYLGSLPDAANHFEKALLYNSNDQTAQLYLYDTYKLLGKNTKAYRLSRNFSRNTLSLLPEKRKTIEAIYTGGGYSFSNNFALNDELVTNEFGDTTSGYQVLIGDKAGFYAGVSLNISPTFSLYTSYNHLDIKKKFNSQYYEVPLVFDSVKHEDWGYQNYFSVDTTYYRQTFDETIKQDEFYLNLKTQLKAGWSVLLFSNFIPISKAKIRSEINQITITDTNYQIIGEEPVLFDYEYNELQFTRVDTVLLDYVAGINIEKDYNNITYNLIGSFSKLNKKSQFQLVLSTNYYLNKQASFYGLTSLAWLAQKTDTDWDQNTLILTQKLGGRIYRSLWCEADFTYGNLNNGNIENGSIVYNQTNNMNYNGGVKFRMLFGKHFEISLLYRYSAYESNFIEYTDNEQGINLNNITFDYQTQSLYGGLKWKF